MGKQNPWSFQFGPCTRNRVEGGVYSFTAANHRGVVEMHVTVVQRCDVQCLLDHYILIHPATCK